MITIENIKKFIGTEVSFGFRCADIIESDSIYTFILKKPLKNDIVIKLIRNEIPTGFTMMFTYNTKGFGTVIPKDYITTIDKFKSFMAFKIRMNIKSK
jgi:hypothetical protein